MARIHNSRHGWTLTIERDCVNVIGLSAAMSFTGMTTCELELAVYDRDTVQQLMDIPMDDTRRDMSVSSVMSMHSGYYRVRMLVSEAEAHAIATGTPPLDVLLPKNGTVIAVPVDMAALLKELEWEVTE